MSLPTSAWCLLHPGHLHFLDKVPSSARHPVNRPGLNHLYFTLDWYAQVLKRAVTAPRSFSKEMSSGRAQAGPSSPVSLPGGFSNVPAFGTDLRLWLWTTSLMMMADLTAITVPLSASCCWALLFVARPYISAPDLTGLGPSPSVLYLALAKLPQGKPACPPS